MSHRADPESPHPVAVHRSKRDTWLAVILWVSAVALVASAAAVGVASMSAPTKLVLILLLLAGAALCVWPLYTTVYRIEGERLLIRCAPAPSWAAPSSRTTHPHPEVVSSDVEALPGKKSGL